MRNLIQKMVYNKYIPNAANAQTLFKHFHKDLVPVPSGLQTDIMSGDHNSHYITLKPSHEKYTYLFS